MDIEELAEVIMFWAVPAYGLLVVVSDALQAIAEELEDAAQATSVEWDNHAANALRAFQEGLARVLAVVGGLVPRIKSRREK